MDIPQMSAIPSRARVRGQRDHAPAGTPCSCYAGDIVVPWNVGSPVFRLKAARDMRLTNITIDVAEIISPTGCPVVIEAWVNGKYTDALPLTHGATAFGEKVLTLKKLDEIQLRLVVKGEHTDETRVTGLWFLYCVG